MLLGSVAGCPRGAQVWELQGGAAGKTLCSVLWETICNLVPDRPPGEVLLGSGRRACLGAAGPPASGHHSPSTVGQLCHLGRTGQPQQQGSFSCMGRGVDVRPGSVAAIL